MLPNSNLLYQFGAWLDFKLQKYCAKTAFHCTFFYVTSVRQSDVYKKDVTRCYAALALYGQQFVDNEKGHNSKAILAAAFTCVTHGFLRPGVQDAYILFDLETKIFISDFSVCILNLDQHAYVIRQYFPDHVK